MWRRCFWAAFSGSILSEPCGGAGFALLVLAFVIHTFGLGFRMYLEGRPPVTNLYSSAIFIGWGACLLGIILERIFKGGIGLVAGRASSASSRLIIAHHLALSGDTMEMLRAVLDTNLWLSTHVVVVTLGICLDVRGRACWPSFISCADFSRAARRRSRRRR